MIRLPADNQTPDLLQLFPSAMDHRMIDQSFYCGAGSRLPMRDFHVCFRKRQCKFGDWSTHHAHNVFSGLKIIFARYTIRSIILRYMKQKKQNRTLGVPPATVVILSVADEFVPGVTCRRWEIYPINWITRKSFHLTENRFQALRTVFKEFRMSEISILSSGA